MRLAATAIALLLFAAPAAEARQDRLSKQEARAEALRFLAPIVDTLDLNRTVQTRIVRARDCRRVTRRTVTCRFSAYLEAEGRTVRGKLRVHLQRDGLLGFLLPWDPSDYWV